MRAVSFLMVGLAAGALACGNGDDASSPVAIAMEAGADGIEGPRRLGWPRCGGRGRGDRARSRRSEPAASTDAGALANGQLVGRLAGGGFLPFTARHRQLPGTDPRGGRRDHGGGRRRRRPALSPGQLVPAPRTRELRRAARRRGLGRLRHRDRRGRHDPPRPRLGRPRHDRARRGGTPSTGRAGARARRIHRRAEELLARRPAHPSDQRRSGSATGRSGDAEYVLHALPGPGRLREIERRRSDGRPERIHRGAGHRKPDPCGSRDRPQPARRAGAHDCRSGADHRPPHQETP